MHIVEFVIVAVAVMAVVVWLVGQRHTLGSVQRTPGAAPDSRADGSWSDVGSSTTAYDSVALSTSGNTSATDDGCGVDSGADGGDANGGSCDGGSDGGSSD